MLAKLPKNGHEIVEQALSVIVTLIGAIVLLGWYFKIEIILQVHPSFVAMQYNTALGFFLSGLACLSIQRYKLGFARFLSVIVFLIGALTMWQIITGYNLHIDQLLMKHYQFAKTTVPGRMATSSAFCFTLVGLVTFIFSSSLSANLKAFAKSLLVPAILALALIALTGYVFHFQTSFGLGNLTQMAVHTSIGFVLLGLILLLLRLPGTKLNVLYSIGIALLVVVLIMWQSVRTAQTMVIQNKVNERGLQLQSNWQTHNDVIAQALLRMVARWEAPKGESDAAWRIDAKNYVDDFDFIALVRQDSNGKLTVIGNESVSLHVLTLLSGKPCLAAKPQSWQLVEDSTDNTNKLIIRAYQLSSPPSLTSVPTVGEGGCLVAVSSIRKQLNFVRKKQKYEEFYPLTLIENERVISQEISDGLWSKQFSFDPKQANLSIKLTPSKAQFHGGYQPEWILLVGLLFGSLVLFALHWLRVAKMKEQETKLAQNQLAEKNRQLQENLALHHGVIAKAPYGIVLTDQYGVIELTNPALEKMFGYQENDLVGKPIEILIAQSLHKAHVKQRSDYQNDAGIAKKMAVNRQVFGMHRSGESIPVEVNIASVNLGGRQSALAMVVDLRDRLKAKRQIAEQNERFMIAADAAKIGVWDYDVLSQTLLWDDWMYRIYGMDSQNGEQPYDLWSNNLHPDDRKASEKALNDAINGIGSFDTEFRIIYPNGEIRNIKGVGAVQRDANGRGIRVYGVNFDITDIKNNERKLIELTHNLQSNDAFKKAIMDSSEFSFVSTDLEGVIQTFNRGAEKMLGYSADEMINKQTPAILHDINEVVARAQLLSDELQTEIIPGFDVFVLKARMTNRPDENQWTYIAKDGTRIPIMLSVTAIRNEKNQLTGYLGIAKDITEQLLNQQKQKEFTDKLTRVNEDLNSFTYIASHDLKSPLRGIFQLATWISEDLEDNINVETKEHLHLMRNRILRMEMLLDDLLAYSRVGRSTDDFVSINTQEMIENIFELQAPEKPIQLIIADDMPIVFAQKVPLELIFRNLIGNSIKHHDKPNGVIKIAFKKMETGFEFSVQDDGPGIPPEHQQRIFTIFQTLKSRDELEGSGIGLAIVKKAVESVGGKVTVESDGKQGATFRFTWPTHIIDNKENG